MKILRIEIHNIASIEDAMIDFASGPLADERLFLICGETGSGKSTILNAICLALYNCTPALFAYGSNDKDANGLTTRNPSQMLRRGAREGSVSLDFEGNDVIAYRAVWSARKIKTRDKSLKVDVKTRVERLSDGLKSEIPVAELTGLTFKQFTQTTILAQGQFTRFLLADEAEKAEILEKLTGTEVYATIGKRIYDTLRKKEEVLKSLTDRIAGAKLLTDDEKTALADELPGLQGNIIRSIKEINEVDTKFRWIADRDTIDRRLAENVALRAAAEAALKGDDHMRKAETVRVWEATARVRALMGEVASAEAGLRDARQQRPRLRDRFASILGSIEKLADDRMILQRSVAEMSARLEKLMPQTSMLAEAARIRELAKRVEAERAEAAACDERKRAIGKEMDIAREKLRQAAEKTRMARERHEASAGEAEKLASAASAFDVKAIAEATESLRSQALAQSVAQTALDRYRTCSKQREQAHAAVAEAEAEAEGLAGEIRRQSDEIPRLEASCREKRALLEGMMELKDHIQALRLKFAESRECPLCGSKGVDLATDALLDSKVAEARTGHDLAKTAYDTASAALAKSRAALGALDRDLVRKRAQAALALEAEKAARAEAREAASAAGIDCDAEGCDAEIVRLKARLEQESAALAERLDQALAAHEASEKARKAADRDRAEMESSAKDAEGYEKMLATLGLKSDAEETMRRKAMSMAADAYGQICEVLCDGYAAAPEEMPALSAKISAEAKEYEKLKSSHSSAMERLSAMEARISEARSAVAPLSQAFQQTSPAGRESKPEMLREVADLIAETGAVDGRIESLSSIVREKTAEIDAYMAEPDSCTPWQIESVAAMSAEDIAECKREVKADEDRLLAACAACAEVEARKAEHQKSKPVFAESDSPESLAAMREEAESLREKASKRQAAVEALLQDDARRAEALAATRRERDALKAECADWAVLEDLYGGAKGQKFRLMAQSYVLRTLLSKANHYLSMLSQRYELCCSDNSLVINVIDHDQSDIARPVTLLSGGESFIVSLSLALGLSAISKERIDVDTLFIDEGFGTLDNSILETVITTLDRLHRIGGRRVGIISHVASLAERIPAQIRMRRTGPGTSAIEVVVN